MARSPTPPPSAHCGDPGDPLAGTAYRTVARLGAGGMGEVVEAEHLALRKRVVVKLLHRELAHDVRFADRLRVEAQALAAVSSPHVVSVTDLGVTLAGRAYLVMERLHGRTLREELDARGPIPLGEAIGITRQVLAGLGAAHRLGIVHRDVKLDNVFLCAPGELRAPIVKVLDFGIAKVLQAEASPLPGPHYPTEEGLLVGSPRTVSPEQARFQKVDARTDVYAAGLLLYTLVAGRGPFLHDNVLDLLNAHIREAPAPPSRVAAQRIPPDLDRAILKALAKRPEHRFQSAELFAEELGRIADALAGMAGPRSGAPGAGEPWRRGETPSEIPTAPGVAPEAPRTTAQGTLVLRPAAAEIQASTLHGAPESSGSWSATASNEPPLAELPANLAPPARRAAEPRLFALLTLASAVLFSLIGALLLRYLAGGRP
jgi:serine/threonine-protein kinase